MFKYYLYRFAQFLVNRLPLEASYALAIFLSDLHYFFSFRDRRQVRDNLKKILPPTEDLRRATREVFRNFGKYLTEFLRMGKMVEKDFLARKIKIQNAGRIQALLKEGKGIIIVTAHIGNWELGAVLLTVLGFPLMAVALPHKERPVNELFNNQRKLPGMEVIPTSGAIKKCLEGLRDNKMIAIVGDRDFSFKGVGEVMDFLGHKALIPKGAGIFALKTGAPIVPTFLIREEDDTFTLHIEEPIFPPSPEADVSEHEAILGIMREYVAVIEKQIRRYPTQCMMFRDFCVSAVK